MGPLRERAHPARVAILDNADCRVANIIGAELQKMVKQIEKKEIIDLIGQ